VFVPHEQSAKKEPMKEERKATALPIAANQ
jgi:hypothetical protein